MPSMLRCLTSAGGEASWQLGPGISAVRLSRGIALRRKNEIQSEGVDPERSHSHFGV
jgi:hypothetical protein